MGGGSSLPYDVEIEYLGFQQNCSIDTGIKPSTNYKYYWRYLWTGITNWTYPFTNNGTNGSWFIFGGIESSNKTQIHIKSSSNINGRVLYADTLYDGSFMRNGSNMEVVLNNTLMVALAYSDYQSGTNLCIKNTRNLTIQIYGFKIVDDNSNTILDLIPVRVGTTGYLYDKISGQLFGNSGTGDFVLGPDKGLPYDAEVEYLQSTGTAYINTGITPTLSYSVEMEFKWVSPWATTDAAGTLFGTMAGWNKNTFMVVCTASNNNRYIYNCWGNYSPSNINAGYINGLLDSWHSLTFRDKRTYIDGTSISIASSGTQQPIYSVYVFCANYNNNSTYGRGTTKQIRSFKMYDASSNLVMDLIPVRKGTTGYMYDKVSKQLFGNAGTDAFVLGPDKN